MIFLEKGETKINPIKQKMTKKNFDLKKNFNLSFEYVKESKTYIYASILIFVVFLAIGFFVPATEGVENLIQQFIDELLNRTQDMGFLELTGFIFLNNIQSSFLGMIYGILLGIFPVLAAAANGYLLGFVASESVLVGGIFILWRIFPHGIFELPALFISLGLGIKLGTFIFKEKKIETLKEYFINSLRAFVFVVIPLLVIAAVIEGALIIFFG